MAELGPQTETSPEPAPAQAEGWDFVELIGIEPLEGNMPKEETARLVSEVQAGGPEASAAEIALIASRLNWMHDSYAQREEIQGRADLEPQDILAIGSQAVILAARKINTKSSQLSNVFQNEVYRQMNEVVVEGKLLPTIEDGKIVHSVKRFKNRGRMVDNVIPAGSAIYGMADRERPAEDPHDEVVARIIAENMEQALGALSDRERHIVEAWLGINGHKDLSELADIYKVSKSYIHQVKDRALVKLSKTPEIRELGYLLGFGEKEYEAEEEVVFARHRSRRAEKARRFQAWLKEIALKQDRGEVAYVRGSLQKRFLPPAVEEYLVNGCYEDDNGKLHFDADGLRAALAAAKVQRAWFEDE